MTETYAPYVCMGGVGLTIELELGIDLTDVTYAEILWEKPSGKKGKWEANKGDTSISYTTTNKTDGWFDEAGLWKIQPYCESETWKIYGKQVQILVRETIEVSS